MRITNYIMNQSAASNINTNKVAEDKINTQISTGKKVNRPSDDPVVAIRALRLRTDLSEVDQYYSKNIPDAKSWLSVTEDAIKSVTQNITSLYEDYMTGSAGFKKAEDREKILKNLQGIRDEIYSVGNASYAGRYVFTGYRTSDPLVFSEDTKEKCTGIEDCFKTTDIEKAAYLYSPLSKKDVNDLNISGNEVTSVIESTFNRIRLSYDDLDNFVRYVPFGFNGDEIATLSGWGTTKNWSTYVVDNKLNTNGQSYTDTITTDSGGVVVTISPECNKTLNWSPKRYSGGFSFEKGSIKGNEDKFTIGYKGKVYTFEKDASGTYTADGNATVVKGTDNKLLITIPDGNRGMFAKAEVSASSTWVDFLDGELVTSVTDMGSYLKVPYGDIVYTVSKNGGTYSVDNNASLKNNGDGTLTITIPGNTKESYTEIVINESGSGEGKVTPYSMSIEMDLDIRNGNVYSVSARNKTNIAYRSELSESVNITSGSVKRSPFGEVGEFEVSCGSDTYLIKRLDDGRYRSFDAHDRVRDDVEVCMNSDGSFTISASTAVSGIEKNVINVKPNAEGIGVCYKEHLIEAQITTSDAIVATGADGKALTAYQYVAVDEKGSSSAEASDKAYLLSDTGELVFGSGVEAKLSSAKEIKGVPPIAVKYDKTNFEKNDLRPEHYFNYKNAGGYNNVFQPIIYDVHDREISYAIGFDQDIVINTNASEVFDPQITRDLDDLIRIIEQCIDSAEKYDKLNMMKKSEGIYTDEQMNKIESLFDTADKEFTYVTDIMQKRFENCVGRAQKYLEKVNRALAEVGNRSSRIDLIENRLSAQTTSFKMLTSENEDVDMAKAAIELSSMDRSYQAALMTTGRIAQTTLLNYL